MKQCGTKTMRVVVGAAWLLAIAPLTAARAADCANASDQATLNQCAEQDYKKADAQLNAIYKQVMDRLKGDAAKTKLLSAAEKAWISFRDANCAFESSGVEGGSIQPMIDATCLASSTNQRIKQLQEYLHCKEGDLSCPVPN